MPVKQATIEVRNVSEKDHEKTAYVYRSGDEDIIPAQTGVRRLFSSVQIFFFGLTYMSSWEGVVGCVASGSLKTPVTNLSASNLAAVLYNGGPQTLAWGTLVVTAGALAQSASLAELSSLQPIAGAQYHWTALLAPAKHRRLIVWLQGWMTWFGWISILAGVANVTAYFMQAIAAANYPSYVPERWHLTLIIIAMLAFQTLFNVYAFRLIPWLEVCCGVLHVALFVVFVAVLLSTAPKNSSSLVFFERASGSGWENSYVSWNLGLLTPVWGFVGFDAAVHMGEETRKARHAVPRAMFWSIAINAVLAYAMSLTVLYCMGSLEDTRNSTFPILSVILTATGSLKAATVMCSLITFTSFNVNLSTIASVSRLTWAWARDGGLPAYFSYVNPRHRIPVRALYLPVTLTALLSLLNIASTAAFGAFIALASMALFTSYFIAIACMVYARLSDASLPSKLADQTKWTLGRWGLPINIFALLYTAYVFIFLPFPNFLPVTALNMNYSVAIFGFAVVFSIGSWLAYGRKHWRGINLGVLEAVLKTSDWDGDE